MTNLMIDHHLRTPPKEEDPKEVRAVARSRTLTLLRRLDGERKGHVVQFLYESGLITKDRTSVNLAGANLEGAYLTSAILSGAKGVSAEELDQQADVLKGATMPNRQKYEDWLKDREPRRENGKDE